MVRAWQGKPGDLDPSFVDMVRNSADYLIAFLLNDYQAAANLSRRGVELGPRASLTGREDYQNKLIYILSLLQEGVNIGAYSAGLPPVQAPIDDAQRKITHVRAEGELGHYQT